MIRQHHRAYIFNTSINSEILVENIILSFIKNFKFINILEHL